MSVKVLAVCAACLQAVSAPVFSQALNRSVDVPANGHVVIELVDGDVTVRGWDRSSIDISGELGHGAQELEVVQQGDETLVRVIETPAGADDARDNSTALFVSIPRGSSVTVDATNADVLVAGVEGALSLNTVSGDIDAEYFGAAVDAETVGGDIRVFARGTPGEATLTTVAGEIEAGGVFRAIDASTVSGDIELDVLGTNRLNLNTTNGDIEVHATFQGAAELTAETINGDVELRVGEEGELNVDAGTFSGRVSTCFRNGARRTGPDADGQADRDQARDGRRGDRDRNGRNRELVIAADDGDPRVRVRTLNGDIEICAA